MTMLVPLQLCFWSLFVSCAFFTKAAVTRDSRIADGELADWNEYPFQVALEYNKSHRCGAVILSKNWVLTAAQCLQNAKAENLRVRWGTPVRGIGGTVHQAIQILPFHQFYGRNDYDIALIKVSPDFASNTSISLVDRNLKLSNGLTAIVLGWGAASSGGSLRNNLQVVEMSLIEGSNCQQLYRDVGDITPRMICATHLQTSSHGPCTGDSGGALVVEGKLLGIVSWGIGCDNDINNPAVFTNVQPFRTWIETFIGETAGNW